jgi:hypothetical protein
VALDTRVHNAVGCVNLICMVEVIPILTTSRLTMDLHVQITCNANKIMHLIATL